jgi:hypothetical protein
MTEPKIAYKKAKETKQRSEKCNNQQPLRAKATQIALPLILMHQSPKGVFIMAQVQTNVLIHLSILKTQEKKIVHEY